MANMKRKRRKHKQKGIKFWVLFVAIPVTVVLCSSIAFYGLYVKRKSSGAQKQSFEKGKILAGLNRHTDAIAEYRKELQRNPGNLYARFQMGLSYIKLKEYDKAEGEFKTIIKAKPTHFDASIQLAIIDMTKAAELRKLGESESLVLERLLDAEDICRGIIEKNPNYAQAYALLGEIHFSQGLVDDAIVDFKRIIKLNKSYIPAHVSLVRLYINKGNLAFAKKECDMLLSELDPDNYQARLLLATISEQQGKVDEAIASYKLILEKKPEDIMARTQLGLLLLRLSKFDEAYAEAEQVSKINPSAQVPAVYFIKGSVLLQRKEYKKAISLLKESILRLPKLMEPHYFLALALAEEGRIEEAKTEFKTAVELAPDFIPAKLNLARLLSKEGWQKETISLCKDILELKPDNVDALQMLGLSYVKTQDYENAEKQFGKVLKLNYSIGEVNMAYLSLASGQLSKCIRQCEAILMANPKAAKAYDLLGLAHIRRGNFEIGIEQFKKGIEINPKSSATLLNLAKAYTVTENNVEARKALEKIISIEPNSLHARTVLASLYEKDGDFDAAAKIHEKTLEINPDYVQGYALARMYFLQGKSDESIDLYNKAVKLVPGNAVLYFNIALSYQQKENYHTSISYCKKAIELKPEVPSFKLVLTNIYAANGEFSKAEEQIESIPSFTFDQKKAYLELLDLCQLNHEKGKQVAFALNKAVFARQVGLFDLAISECKKAMEIFPENIVPKVILANTYLSTNRNDEAIAIYSEIIKDKPEFASSYYDLGRAYLMTDKQDEAISMYQNMIGVDSKSISGRLALAGVLIKQGDAEKAAKMLSDVIALEPENLIAHNLLGKVSLAEKNFEKAESEFTKMIELRSDTFEGHFNMARMKFAQGDFDKCIEHCKKALETRPVDVRIHNILGMAYMRKGLIKDAVFEFNKIIDINSDFVPAFLNLANINIAAKKPDIAALLYKAALKVKPDTVEARFGLGNSYALMGKYSESVTEFDSIIKEYPNNVNVYISLAKSYMAMDDNIKAHEAITNALSIETDNPTARSVLAKIYVGNEDMPQAISQLKRVLSKNQKLLNVYDLGILYIDIEEYENAIFTYEQGVENFPENSLLWYNLAVAYQINKDYKGAREACTKALSFQPDGTVANLCMLNLYMAKGEFENAERHLKAMTTFNDTQKSQYLDLIKLCGRNKELGGKIPYHLARALAYTNNRWFNRIVREYDKITNIAPANIIAYESQIDSLLLMGKKDKAKDICKEIIELEPELTHSYNKLAGIYHSEGKLDEALKQYRKVISIDQNNVSAFLNLGVILESKDMLEESISAYRKVIELSPESPTAYNNLAWLYASKMQDKMDEALVLAEKAKELSPNTPAISDTLGWIYYLNASYDEAVSELRAAVRNATWNPTIRYHLGVAYYKKGLQRDALTELERALKISSSFPEAKEAKEIIEKIIISRVKGTDR
ncbi:MAG: tetratricopeptide repeat protein [Candidatus Scalindua sp.]|jgi:tetratricopeptide (TPR) repeat protein|nr:tetratricopeptide repeat protein [Candidatus Scalindua sp.]MBT6045637.1 tetratricopeptide repeat protein [Candidatus Scalindua sp.]MBT6227986.1 tetratricopeptide repeat protein [Candidatus Scalindua sp.]MBT6561698.1 tetratricopeptide repeat protein [Candidatus Scalindua sp.]MBT7211100.1 tetratricopeptide repeat protein [Candidatus Scalindua sp.]